MAYLGNMAERGLATKKDIKVAVEWYEKAAQGNNAYSARRLVDIYANSRGALRDRKKALYWQIKLGKGGDVTLALEAAEALSRSAQPGDKQTTLDLYKVAADDGNLEATVKWSRGQILEEASEPDFHGAVNRLLRISKSDPLASLGPLSGLVRNTEIGKWRKQGERNRNLFSRSGLSTRDRTADRPGKSGTASEAGGRGCGSTPLGPLCPGGLSADTGGRPSRRKGRGV